MALSQPSAPPQGQGGLPFGLTASRIDGAMEATWLAVAAGVPLLFNPAGEHPFGLYKAAYLFLGATVLLTLWLVRRAALLSQEPQAPFRGFAKALVANPLLLAALALGLAYIVATAFSVTPVTSFWGSLPRMTGTVTVLSLLGLFLAMGQHLREERQVDRLLWAIAGSAALVALLGVLEWLRWVPSLSMFSDKRVGSTIGNPIFLGAYLVMTLPLTASLALVTWRWRQGRKALYPYMLAGLASSLLLQGLALVLTASRGPWLGGVAMAGAFLLLAGIFINRRRLRVGLLAGALMGLLFLLLVLPASPLAGLRKLPYLSRAASVVDLNDGSVKSRLLIWKATLQLVWERPSPGGDAGESALFRHLVGYGPETFPFVFTMVMPREVTYLLGPRMDVDRAHNLILDLMTGTGLLGIGSFLALVAAAYWYGLQALKRAEALRRQLLLIGLLAALSGHLVEQAFGIAEVSDLTIFWTLLGLMVAVVRLSAMGGPAISPVAPAQAVTVRPSPGRVAVLGTGGVALCLLAVLIAGSAVMADVRAAEGTRLTAERRWISAAASFERAAGLAPYRALYQWHVARMDFLLAQELKDQEERARRLNLALERIWRAEELEPTNHTYALREAQMHAFAALALGVESDREAASAYQRAAALSPGDPDLLNEWSLYELRSIRVPQALTLAERSSRLDPSYPMTRQLLALITSTSAPGAAADLVRQRGMEHMPYFWDAYIMLADTYYRMGRPALALEPALRYASAAPGDPGVHKLLEAIYRALGLHQ